MSTSWQLTEKAAAERTGFATGTLRNWRVYGLGPKWLKLPNGSIRYDAATLEQWMLSGLEAAA